MMTHLDQLAYGNGDLQSGNSELLAWFPDGVPSVEEFTSLGLMIESDKVNRVPVNLSVSNMAELVSAQRKRLEQTLLSTESASIREIISRLLGMADEALSKPQAKNGNSNRATPQGELMSMWKMFKEHPTEELRNELVMHYAPLVRLNAERIWARLPDSVDLDDLITAGFLGLMDAIRAFDCNRGVKFETYCIPRIRGAIIDELRTMDWAPRLVRLKATKLREATDALYIKFGRQPTIEELAEQLGQDVPTTEKIIEESRVVDFISLDKKWYETDNYKDVREIDILEDENAQRPESRIEHNYVLKSLFRGLNITQRLVLIGYYWEGKTMKAIGEDLGLAESRISQIHSQIMRMKKNEGRDVYWSDRVTVLSQGYGAALRFED